MQLNIWPHALMVLSIAMQVDSEHFSRSDLASMDHTAVANLSSAESGLHTRDSIPHDVPEHPHCTFTGKDSTRYMVFSKDFGRHDETSTAGCGSDMLQQLRNECGGSIVNWKCIGTPKGEHSSFMEFKVPIMTSWGGTECVEKAFRKASGPQRQQVLSCCARGKLDCRKRNCEEYQKTHAGFKC